MIQAADFGAHGVVVVLFVAWAQCVSCIYDIP
jgi:hypothetical protein